MRLASSLFSPVDHKRELPSSPPVPALLQTMIGRLRPLECAEKCWIRYGNRFALKLVDMAPIVFCSDPHDIRAIATADPDDLHAGAGGALMEPLFGDRSFALFEKEEHANVRRAIMPPLHGSALQDQADMLAAVVDREVVSWPADTVFSLSPHLYRLTLKAMLMIAVVGLESEYGEQVYETLCKRMLDMLSVMGTPLLQEPRLRRLPGWRGTWRRFVQRRHAVDELVYELIARRRQENADSAGWHNHKGDLLDLLIAACNPDGSPLSDKQVRDNLISVIIAGQETTAATIAWAFQLLAHNPLIQERLIEEIDGGSAAQGGSAYANSDEVVSAGADDGGEAGGEPCGIYMNAVIQETLRHRPTFLFLPPRVVLRQTEIGGWTYRPPTQLAGCTYLMHHDPELHANPHAFRPERFLDGAPQPGTLLPWGVGRKRCPGRQLALMEIRMVLRRALSMWQVLPASARIERPHWRTVILAPHAGSRVILRSRHSLRPGLSRTRRNSI